MDGTVSTDGIVSTDGTPIAYDRQGAGPAAILVGGAPSPNQLFAR